MRGDMSASWSFGGLQDFILRQGLRRACTNLRQGLRRLFAIHASNPVANVVEAQRTRQEPFDAAVTAPGFLGRRQRCVVAALWLVLLAQCVAFAFIQPVWSRVDEAQHFHFVQYIVENKSLPVEGKTFISPLVVDISIKSNQWGWRPVGALSTPAQLDPGKWITVPPELSDQEREKWVRRNLWYFNYEAMQPPLYYIVNVPLYLALPADPFVKLFGMRLLAALFASVMLPLTYFTAREAFPDSRLVMYGAPVVMLLTQGYALNMSQVSNDALAVPLAALALLLLLRMVGRGLTWKQSLMAGAVIGASLLGKLTTVFLLLVALEALGLMVAYGREQLRRVLLHAGLIFTPVALMLAPWLIRNISVYGDATGARAARTLMSSFFSSPLRSLETLRLNELLPTYWFGEPVFPFPFWTYAWVAVGAAMVIAALGLMFYLIEGRRRQVQAVQIKIMFLLLALVTGTAVNLLIPFGSGIGGVPGRYLYPLLPAGAFLLVFGIDRLLRRERALFVAEALLIWMIVWETLNFLAYIQNR